MTIPKKIKGVRFRKKVKKSNQCKQTSKRTPVINDDYDTQKNGKTISISNLKMSFQTIPLFLIES